MPRAGRLISADARAAVVAAPVAAPVDRSALRRAYRPDEDAIALERIAEARLSAEAQGEAAALAQALVKGVRAHKASGLDALKTNTE